MLTNFKFIFTPRNILNIKEEIKKKHKNINEKYKNLIVDDRNLIELLKIIDKLNKDELVNFSYKLKKKIFIYLQNICLKINIILI